MKRCVRIEVVRNSGRSSWPSRRTSARRSSVGWRRNRNTQRRRQPRSLGFQTLESRIALSANLPTDPRDFVVVGNVAYFSAYDDAHGNELWRTDGTPAGTILVKDIYEGEYPDYDNNGNEITKPNSSYIQSITAFQGQVFFVATDEWGTGLWKSDGTANGTQLVVPDLSLQGNIVVMGDAMFISSYAGILKSDGTSEGTVQLAADSIQDLTAFANRLFFVADTSSETTQSTTLFAMDGSGAQVEPIATFTDGSAFIIGQVGNSLFLAAETPSTGVELWKSDGTQAGTVLVKDINAGTRPGIVGYDENDNPIEGPVPNDSYPYGVTAIGGGVGVFSAYTNTVGQELWRTDGTAAGTTFVKDLLPGTYKSDGQSYPKSSAPDGFTPYNGGTFFVTADGSLWKTDGTSKGTVLVRKNSGSGSEFDEFTVNPVVLNGRLLYAAFNAKTSDFEIWSSDGTAAGTMRLQDLPPTIASVTLPDAGTYGAGQTLQFTVTFTDAVVVTGKSTLQLTVGKATKLATYVSGSGTNQLVYRYTVGKNDLDTDGIAVASKLVGSITSAAASKVKALLTVPALATSDIRVDAAPPTVSSVTAPQSKNYAVGETLAFLVRFNEIVRVTGVPQIAVTFGKTVLQATYVSGDGTDTLRFEVVAGAVAPTGVKVATSIVLPTGAAITDSWGNAATKLSFKAPVTSGVKVVPQPIDPALYQGQYEGSFGTMASGPITATVVDRTITIAIVVNAPSFGINGVPANGFGTIATDGSFSFTATGGVFGVVFTGQVFPGQNGAVSASGTWKNSKASGTWRVDRISTDPPA